MPSPDTAGTGCSCVPSAASLLLASLILAQAYCSSPLCSLSSLSLFVLSLPSHLPVFLFLFSSLLVSVFLSLSLCFLSDILFVCLTHPHHDPHLVLPGPRLVMVMAKSWEGLWCWGAWDLEQGWAGLCGSFCPSGSEWVSPKSPAEAGPHSSWGAGAPLGAPNLPHCTWQGSAPSRAPLR